MVILVLLVFGFIIFTSSTLSAQCPMCKMAAESNLKDGGSAGKGLNFGILYMLLLPYILVFTLGMIWRRNSKNIDKSTEPNSRIV
ncbi:MAG: hypothetical protein H6567_03605 [Lewinellaceae bacterium]|nr:hypothetical protein [Lewinellaceae bacterium]